MRKIIWLLLTASLAGAWLGWITSSHQVGLTEDCLRYLSMAKHVVAGKGFSLYNPSIGPTSLPYISQAPLWSALIAPGLAVGLSPESWLWTLLMLLLAANLFVAGCTAWYGTRSLTAGLVAQGMLLADAHWRMHHAYALSEPLFFLITQTAVLAFWRYLDSGRMRWLATAAGMAGLAGVTRYIGVTYAAAFALAVLLLDRGTFFKRFGKAVWVGLAGVLPLGLWFLRHYFLRREWFGMHVTESRTGRFFPLEFAGSFFKETLRYPVTNGWVPDRPEAEWIFPLLLTAALGLSVFLWKKRGSAADLILPLVAGVYAAGMIATWTARSVQSYPDSGRLSAPMMAHLWVWITIVFWRFLSDKAASARTASIGTACARCACVVLALWGVGRVPPTYDWMIRAVQTGEYGRPDPVSWKMANRIAWFPTRSS